MSEQQEVIAFLKNPASHQNCPTEVKCLETHGALVFLAGHDVYKIKRAVKYPYLDFSTLAKRRYAVKREIEINRAHAAKIYINAIPITRTPDGGLCLGGEGEIIEWAVHMNRFPQSDLLSAIAARGELDTPLAGTIASMIAEYHASLKPLNSVDGQTSITLTLHGLLESLNSEPRIFSSADVDLFEQKTNALVKRASNDFMRRSQTGFVRRCHGDLHLGNIVMMDGKPVLFDAIEFDERLAKIDILYDLAFLLMDLEHRGLRQAANLVLNHYLLSQNLHASYEGLNLLPLFLSLRAGIRAMVSAQRAEKLDEGEARADIKRAHSYFHQALSTLSPVPARLVVIGGLSGTGKTTLAALLAPLFGAAPGALHLRSDLERKKLFGVSQTERLPSKDYTQASTKKVYALLNRKACLSLKAGHSVIVDAVFAQADERHQIDKVARDLAIPFTGLWLEAPKQTLIERVAARTGDASDATPDIVEQQFQYNLGTPTWQCIDADQSIDHMQRQALKALGLRKLL